jgi:hypothetical protein
MTASSDSIWKLRADVVSTRALLWIAGAGRNGDPIPDVHLYLYDRYWRLAKHHEAAGHGRRAAQLRSRAVWHWRQAGNDGPPFAAAMAMPRPESSSFTRALGGDDGPEAS